MIYYLFQNIFFHKMSRQDPDRSTGLLDLDLDPTLRKNLLVAYTIFNSSVPNCFGSTRSEINLFQDQDSVKDQ